MSRFVWLQSARTLFPVLIIISLPSTKAVSWSFSCQIAKRSFDFTRREVFITNGAMIVSGNACNEFCLRMLFGSCLNQVAIIVFCCDSSIAKLPSCKVGYWSSTSLVCKELSASTLIVVLKAVNGTGCTLTVLLRNGYIRMLANIVTLGANTVIPFVVFFCNYHASATTVFLFVSSCRLCPTCSTRVCSGYLAVTIFPSIKVGYQNGAVLIRVAFSTVTLIVVL